MCRRSAAVTPGALSDAELVARVVNQKDEAAFEVLVWRHGPMVLRLCQRVVKSHHDAEDALQAAFLVLFRKIHTLGNHESVAAWLHRVALRIALRARNSMQRRRTTGIPVEGLPCSAPRSLDSGELVHREIERLPASLRQVAVLCLVQERSYAAAAAEIGCPLGTVQSRLARARRHLQRRLGRHGITASIGVVLAAETSVAAISRGLVEATMASVANGGAGAAPVAVAALVQQSCRAGCLAPLSTNGAKALGALAVLAVCGWWVVEPSPSVAPHRKPVQFAEPALLPLPVRASLARDREHIEGEWQLVAGWEDGRPMPRDQVAATVLKFLPGNRVSLGCRRPDDAFSLEAGERQAHLRLTVTTADGQTKQWRGVYELTPSSLRVRWGSPEHPATDLAAAPLPGQREWILQRPGTPSDVVPLASLE